MVRVPLTPEQLEAGRRLGAAVRTARGSRPPADVAVAAGISPETLRKIETGRMPSPSFGVVVRLSESLGCDVQVLADAWSAPGLEAVHRRAG
ncbi:MAG: helix-turn-helix transcriptional regulator [Nocardioidaceae bacterium]|nr:helix-turn-helix transcriptional regulator [Nocardioidaceae bacterium]